MPIVGLALVLVAAAFLAHLIRWRLARPAATTRALLNTFVCGVSGGLLLVLALAWLSPGLAAWLPSGPFAVLQSLLLALALAAAYVMTYPAIEVESPSLLVIEAIARRGERGLDRRLLFEQLNDEVLVVPRVRDLVSDGLAVEEGGRLRLSASGRRLVRVFQAWRRLLGAEAGG